MRFLLTDDDGNVIVDKKIKGVMYTLVVPDGIQNGCYEKLDTVKTAEMVYRNEEMVQGILNSNDRIRKMFDVITEVARMDGTADDNDWATEKIVKREEEGSENADLPY